MTDHPLRLSPEQTRRRCSITHFEFETTAEFEYIQTIIGQPRGVRAIEFGIDIETDGFNIYVMGPTGTGRTTAIRHFLEQHAREGDVPSDWVYVHNFQIEHQPEAISLSPGQGTVLKEAMDELVVQLKRDIPEALEAEEFTQAIDTLETAFDNRREELFNTFSGKAKASNFNIIRTPAGLMLAPVDESGELIPPEKMRELADEVREDYEKKHAILQEKLVEALREVRELDREFREDTERMRRVAAAFIIDQLIGDLKEQFADNESVQIYLKKVREDILSNLDNFDGNSFENDEEEELPPPQRRDKERQQKEWLKRYSVNVIVDHSKTTGAPVIVEDLPAYAALVGRVEGEVRMGALHTNFTMIKPGALHRANGGYLVLRVTNLFMQPGAWEGLKRALTNREIRIEESLIRTGLGILTPQTLDPKPIPLKLKVILLGSPSIYYMLYGLEEDFPDLFKIKADFASIMERTHETEQEYAMFIATRCHEHNLPHFTPGAVGKLVEYGSRLASHQDKLSTLFGQISDIIHESAYWTVKDGKELVDEPHVQQALDERRYRSNLYEELTQEAIEEGTIFIDTEGEVVGQVNGLSVVNLGDYAFGQPSRITVRVFMGKDGLINIEREVEMSGPIHDKGVLILEGYLGGQYGTDFPLSLSATVTFEQNYSGIEGDSASSTELYALLSALSGYPIKQSLAVTGSINQRGQIQPIGGASEKIEGFFDICNLRGLTGDQGVLIPQSNIKNLMLRDDIVEVIKAGQFHIYAIETVEQGIELLTGVPAGKPKKDGSYPKGTVHFAVQTRLREMSEEMKDTKDED